MITFRDRMTRGQSRTGWLDSRHTFSFAHYQDPAHMGFRSLRVINEDRVIPGAGFPRHGHNDMEIISYVLDGALEHKDSLGNGTVIQPGDVQRMSAGTGILHSEFNPSNAEPVHFLQIWVIPDQVGLPPSYEQKAFPIEERRGQLRLVAAPAGRDDTVTVHQDARLFVANLEAGDRVVHEIDRGRGLWLQLARGIVVVNGTEMRRRWSGSRRRAGDCHRSRYRRRIPVIRPGITIPYRQRGSRYRSITRPHLGWLAGRGSNLRADEKSASAGEANE